jgi:mannosylglycerate hydrolase MGH1-like protein/glycosyl hydrolase family 65
MPRPFRTCLLLILLFPVLGSGIQAAPSSNFAFDSGQADYNQAYEKARQVIADDIRQRQFIAGQGWAEVWTRDSSYSTDLALDLLHPALSKNTLLNLREDVPGIGVCWAQDKCGHFGGWPSLTDAIVGATGAWSLYQATGDREFLKTAYVRTVNSLQRAERDAFIVKTGLFGGCASFMESNSAYPLRYAFNHHILFRTSALSTNALYYHGYVVAADMAAALGSNPAAFQAKARALKAAINREFWQEDKGYYGYFVDENQHLVPQMEGLGEALAILYGIADAPRAARILQSTPTTEYGIPCLWPQFPEYSTYRAHDEISYYHDGMIWPFVEAYWGWAAARCGDTATFNREFGDLLALSQKNDTFMEYYHPQDGSPDGSRNQLWSASGYLGMVYHALFGIELETDGIRFSPVVPNRFSRLMLSNIRYRNQVLSVTIRGSGTKITGFMLNGQRQPEPFVPAGLTGAQRVEIILTHANG